MKKQLFIKLCLGSFGFFFALNTKAQVTFPSNTNPTAGQFVGLIAQPFPLVIAHKGNQPINFITNGINRVHFNQTLSTTIQGVAGQVVDGYVGIAPNGFFANNSPWAMLHLHGNNNAAFGTGGWRKWMQTGTFMDENSDNMYVGMKNEFATQGIDRSDAVIDWSDNETGPPAGPVILWKLGPMQVPYILQRV